MEEEEPIFISVMKKRFDTLGMWKPCTCTLYKGFIKIKQGYRKPSLTKINITSKTKVQANDTNRKNQFLITDSFISHYFVAESKNVMQKWIDAINTIKLNQKNLSINDFNIISTLGRGYFGKVLLCEHKETHDIYAIKAIKKQMLVDEEKVDSIFVERNVLKDCTHPFIVTIYFAFQSSKKFYIGLEYVPGGALFRFLQIGREMNVDEVRFYVAEVALALEYLHSKGIVYRDLKLENVLLCADGHVKLTDFGLSKELMDANGNVEPTSTFCGTNEYLPPEMIEEHSYGLEIDWWTLGIFTYEFIYSKTPFYNKNLKKMYNNILTKQPKFPKGTDEVVKNFILSLLRKDPEERATFDDIVSDPFFENINWDDVYNKKLIPPYLPRAKTGRRGTNAGEKYRKDRLDSDAPSVDDQTGFEGFTFIGAV